MNTTLVHLVRAPRGAIVHVSRSGELTACGRDVPDTWSSELMEPAGALERTTCARCQSYSWTIPQAPAVAPVLEDEQPAAAELPVDRTPLTLLVVPCSGKKLDRPAPARELYRGTLTTMGLAATDVIVGSDEWQTGHAGCRAMILSALHGLVDPDQVLAPYDLRMGDPDSITTGALALQLAATGATRVVALTPSAYTGALRAACELAGVELVAAFEGLRGIGEQRGLLAKLRRSGGYGAEHGALLQLETRRMAQLHADALAEDRARTAAAAPAIARVLEGEPVERCRQSLAGTGGEPCAAPAGHAGRGCDASGQPWSHEAPDEPATKRCSRERLQYVRAGVLDCSCGCVDVEQDHAEALAENEAHDAAVAVAIPEDTYRGAELLAERLVQGEPMYGNRDLTTNPLTPTELQQVELATNLAGQQLQAQHRQMPRAMRYGASRLTLVPPR